MAKKLVCPLLAALLLVVFALSLTPRKAHALFEFQAVNGVLDLSWWSPEQDGPVALSGVWHLHQGLPADGNIFYHNHTGWGFATLPGRVDFAPPQLAYIASIPPLAVYHLRIQLPRRGYPDLALYVPAQSASFSIYVDQQLAVQSGDPFLVLDGGLADNRDRYPLVAPVNGAGKVMDITIVAAPHTGLDAALPQSILLGDSWQMQTRHMQQLSWHITLVGFLALFALFFTVYFALRPNLQQFFFLAAFSAIGAVYAAADGHVLFYVLPDIQYVTVLLLKTLMLVLLVPVYYGYYWRYFPAEFQRIFFYLALAWAVISGIWILQAPAETAIVAGSYAYFPLFLASIIVLAGLLRAWHNGRRSAIKSLPAVLVMMLMALTDLLSVDLIYQGFGLSGPGFAAVLVLASIVGSGDYDRLYRSILQHNRSLEQAREQLRQNIDSGKGLLEERETRLGRLVARDHLTGLISRNGLLERMAVECRRASSFDRGLALAMIDIRQKGDMAAPDSGIADQAIRLAGEEIWSFLADTDYLAHLGHGRFAALIIEGDQARLDVIGQALPARLQTLLPDDRHYVIRVAGSTKDSHIENGRLQADTWFRHLEDRLSGIPADAA